MKEVVVCLLRVYPESASIRFPFIRSIKPLLNEEKELKQTAVSLTYATSSLTKAVSCTKDGLMRSASTVFDSWATSFINTTEGRIDSVSMKLQEKCNGGSESNE